MEKETLDGEDQLGAWAWVALPREEIPRLVLGATQEEPTPLGRGSHLTQHVPPSSCPKPACPLYPHPSPLPQFLESALNFLFLTVLHGMQDLSSLTPCTGAWSVNHWTSGEVN